MSGLRRNLVFCCDGTGNDPSAPTNVKLFKDAVMRASKATEQRPAQAVYYQKGVGTRAFEEISGSIAGTGREKRIKAGYSFLRARYAMPGWRPDQNRVFLLGFSRGAYIVRRLSGMLSFCGLARKAKDEALAWDIYDNRDARGAAKLRREGRCFDIDVEMVGVWDTVKATVDADFDDHELAGNVTAGYHAMAIDEQRKMFPVLRWNREEKRVLEVWFAGVHSDIGGGYERRGLSNITLQWMIYRAAGHGLLFKSDLVTAATKRPSSRIHDSLTGGWKLLGSRGRKLRQTDWIHESVHKKLKRSPDDYHPANLPAKPRYWPPVAKG
jgi:uncharacterized protein (DUF2235 family)